ncbi:DegT/DnrJ/EryC1/StrS aminotransferase family protein [Synechococcus sp. PCC 7335]|uniref:DegT/DnrJ/EryC1/StrS family aminotransferase n=1 Tax=Synechococcus sp. (strain ATCC 29403 / PCC 7335) TaxID=91464 RepID=UPI000570291F|nr:DegT/DnrJ/EryC1/StrS family aminotransferase [Synechococcus sp. PCC 7335]
MKIPILDLKPQYQAIKSEIQSAIDAVLESGQFVLGPTVANFESKIAQYLGVKHAIGVNSGTDALIIGLRALGIGPGDEVITTCFSFFATAESISNVGAKPVFVDIQASSFNIDPVLIEAAITPKTKAIMPVHLYGNPAAMAQIKAIAAKHNLKIIEDCAQSFGAVYKGNCSGCEGTCNNTIRQPLMGKHTGSLGNIGAFSFFPTKNLGAYGDGGLITTDDDRLAELAVMLRMHGSKQKYCNEMLGYNSRLDAIQAAILQVKLNYIDLWNQQRRQVAKTYSQLLEDVANVITPELTDGHVFHQYTIRVLEDKRDHVQRSLADAGVGSMIYYPFPQDRLPIYAKQYPANPVSDELGRQVLSLPMWPELSPETSRFIVKTLRDSL